MQIHELATLGQAPATGTYVAVDTGTATRKLDYTALAQAVVEQYSGSTLAGSAQSVQAALVPLGKLIELSQNMYYIKSVGPAATLSVTDAGAFVPNALTVALAAVQSGSGTPSPANVRPIVPYTEMTVTQTDGGQTSNTITVTIPTDAGTVCVGTVDLVKKQLIVDWAYTTVGDLSWQYTSTNTRFYTTVPTLRQYSGARTVPFVCSAYQTIDDGRAVANVPDASIYGSGSTYIYIKDTRYTDVAAWKGAMGDVQIAYPLATPLVYNLTSDDVTLLRGANTLTAEGLDLSMTYQAIVYDTIMS